MSAQGNHEASGGPKLLKLKCLSAEDVDVAAALFQDAIVRVSDLKFMKSEERFVGLFNRFRWENEGEQKTVQTDAAYEDVSDDGSLEGTGIRQRVHAGLCFDHVTGVRSKNLPTEQSDAFLNLLSIIAGENSATLLFADEITVQVQYKRLALFVEDLGEAWPTAWQPQHQVGS